MGFKSMSLAALLVAFLVFWARVTRTSVHVQHAFSAPVDKVWDLWTDTETMKKWWSPKGYTAPVIKSDFHEGGKFLLSMKSPSGAITYNSGIYREIVPGKRIVTAMSFSDENGTATPGPDVPVPGDWPDEVYISVTFQEQGGKTFVSVTEEGIPLIMKYFAKLGWEQQFEKFEALLQ